MTKIADPTMSEMRAHLAKLNHIYGADDFDIAEAIYWFACDYHGGQSSNLYQAICLSQFNPGPISTGCEEGGVSALLYAELEDEFVDETPRIERLAQ